MVTQPPLSPERRDSRSAHVPHRRALRGYCHRISGLVQFWLDPRLRGRLDIQEVADEIRSAVTRQLYCYRCPDERTLVSAARQTAMSVLGRIHRDYLGRDFDAGGPQALLRLDRLSRANTKRLIASLRKPLPTDPRWLRESDPATGFLQLQRAFNRLPLQLRLVLAMYHFERLTREEVAAVLGTTSGAVGRQYRSALHALHSEQDAAPYVTSRVVRGTVSGRNRP